MQHSRYLRLTPEANFPGERAGMDGSDPGDLEVVIDLEIDGVLDLHTFHPRDVKSLVADYLAECQKRDLLEVRIIHGKGTGQLRDKVHAILERSPLVASYRLASGDRSSWGATLVDLKPR